MDPIWIEDLDDERKSFARRLRRLVHGLEILQAYEVEDYCEDFEQLCADIREWGKNREFAESVAAEP